MCGVKGWVVGRRNLTVKSFFWIGGGFSTMFTGMVKRVEGEGKGGFRGAGRWLD